MKIAIIIFGISLLIQVIYRTKKYNFIDAIDGTLKFVNFMLKLTFITLISSFIYIVWNL